MTPGPVTVQAPQRRPSQWGPQLLALVVFLAILFGAGAVGLDWVTQNLEMHRLVTAIEQSEAAMETTQAEVMATLASTGPDTDLSDAELIALDDELRAEARRGQDRIHTAGLAVDAVAIVPWHRNIRQAQDAYLQHNQAWQDYLGRASDDARELVTEQPEVNDTFAAAEPALKRAVPESAAFHLASRVVRIFVDGQPQPTTDGQVV